MSIDWNKAPEGATHWDSRPHADQTWMRLNHRHGRGWDYWGMGHWIYYGCMPEHQEKQMIKRQDSSWDGQGIPPIGTVCEFLKHNSPPAPEGRWTVGDIRYVSDCTVIIGGENCEHVHHPRNCSFRPVRTPEQIAAEERDKACRQICVDAGGAVTESEMKIAGRLYDAGYRKQVAP